MEVSGSRTKSSFSNAAKTTYFPSGTFSIEKAPVTSPALRPGGTSPRAKFSLKVFSTTSTTEATACGAAILAAVGAGAFASVEEACDSVSSERDRIEPGPDREVLAARHEIFARLYPALQPEFPAIAGNG